MIRVVWSNREKTVLLMKFSHRWTREQFWNASQSAHRMINSVDHLVDVIVDLSVSQSTPRNLIQMVVSSMRMTTPQTGKVVVISRSTLWSNLYGYIKRVYPNDVIAVDFVPTYQDAKTIIKQSFSVDELTDTPPTLGYSTSRFARA